MTIKEFLEEIEKAFQKAGISCASREALLLACHVLSVDQIYLFTHKDEYIDEKILLAAAALVNERCKGRPLAYIIGTADFYGVNITVDERALIPRPETELLVEEILKSEYAQKTDLKILDLCTGSGCIAAALASKLPNANIIASELSIKAFQLASYNCRPYENIKVIRSDLFEKICDEKGEGLKFDIIVSNPPYVAETARAEMQREVKDFEPEMALFAGENGLDVIKRIMPEIPKHLNEEAIFLMEIGDDQGDAVKKLAEDLNYFTEIQIKKDLAGLDRYLYSRI